MEILFDLGLKEVKVNELREKTLDSDFWQNASNASNVNKEIVYLENIIDDYKRIYDNLNDYQQTLMEISNDDLEMLELIQSDLDNIINDYKKFEIQMLLSHEYDHSNAIVELHPGAGGVESCDWVEMIYRMYSRYANKKGYKISVYDYIAGEEAGIKSISFLVEGHMAYGLLKAEKGVHRLVRVSPFDSGGRRHTSFASVDIMPQFNNEIVIDINPNDLIIDTHRASGAGGQHINKTDSAVRITHKPTGIVVSCQNGRSQHDNKEQAMIVLKSRLYNKYVEEQEKEMLEIKGELKANEWGSQIRSYVFCPYTMVKDLRTSYEVSDVNAVMDGDIDEFIYAYLKYLIK